MSWSLKWQWSCNFTWTRHKFGMNCFLHARPLELKETFSVTSAQGAVWAITIWAIWSADKPYYLCLESIHGSCLISPAYLCDYSGCGVQLTAHRSLVPRLRMPRTQRPLPTFLLAWFLKYKWTTLHFFTHIEMLYMYLYVYYIYNERTNIDSTKVIVY